MVNQILWTGFQGQLYYIHTYAHKILICITTEAIPCLLLSPLNYIHLRPPLPSRDSYHSNTLHCRLWCSRQSRSTCKSLQSWHTCVHTSDYLSDTRQCLWQMSGRTPALLLVVTHTLVHTRSTSASSNDTHYNIQKTHMQTRTQTDQLIAHTQTHTRTQEPLGYIRSSNVTHYSV